MEEVLQRKILSEKWINWINSGVKGGRVCIDMNGERGEYFRSFKGLRQGDPLSPLLFNIVGDALSAMLSEACATGAIQGLIPHLVEGGVYIRLILNYYEAMSGLKMNFEKSEVFTVGLDEMRVTED